jgi:NAD(P)-dependent dehydrogenase (short-subunit alcohol dehydrogenase family)
MKELDPKKPVAVVTGGNRGIGFEICRGLAEKGLTVILTSRDERKEMEACEALRAEGLEVHDHQLDVTDLESIRNLAKWIKENFSRLDVLINNAGISIDGRLSVFEVDEETMRATMETNLFGPLWVTQELLPLIRENGYGRIVNVSSRMGQLASMGRGDPAYRLSKASLNALTVIMSRELVGADILVNAMCPGWVRTDMGGSAAPRSVEQGADTAIWLATLPKGGPQGKYFRDREEIPW